MPYVLVNTVSVLLYKKLGVSITDITYYTSLLALPWVVKPLWGPLVDLYWTKRRWVLLMQFILALAFAIMAVSLQSPLWWGGSLAVFALAAFLSATHDIAADGFYMIGLSEHKQALFVGIRSTFYRIALIFGTGLLVILAGFIEEKTGPPPVLLDITATPPGAQVQPAASNADGGDFVRFEPRHLVLDAGTTAAVNVTLAAPPAKDDMTTIAIARKNSSVLAAFFPIGPEQLIKIEKGDQLEFSTANWNQPQEVIFAADAKLKEQATATFRATAGDFRLTWTLCFAGMAALFLLLLGIHAFFLPKPAADGTVGAPDKPPFLLAAAVLFVTMAIPCAALWYGRKYFALGLEWMVATINNGTLPVSVPVINFVATILLVLLVWGLIKIRPIGEGLLSGFHFASRKSGVGFAEIFISFFQKPGVGLMIAFLLLFRLSEALLLKMATPFLLDARDNGGLALTQSEYGLAYGTIGILMLTAGGILGGLVAGTGGLKRWLVPMFLALNLPNAFYWYLAAERPEGLGVVFALVGLEQFGYGFGFSAYMIYMLYIAGQGEHKTSHFAISTGFMALSMMLPGMISGEVYKEMGSYPPYFIFVVVMALPGLLLLPFIPLDPEFGKKGRPA